MDLDHHNNINTSYFVSYFDLLLMKMKSSISSIGFSIQYHPFVLLMIDLFWFLVKFCIKLKLDFAKISPYNNFEMGFISIILQIKYKFIEVRLFFSFPGNLLDKICNCSEFRFAPLE